MKVVSQSHEWITPLNRDVTLKRIEQIARTCYQSEGAIKPGSAEKMVAMLCKNHHYAMIEHISLTCKFITDRGVANEIVRHRIGSYAQESTRYCNYSKDKFDNQITVIDHGYTGVTRSHWLDLCHESEVYYQLMIESGATAEQARDVLPLCLKTEIVCTWNLREWHEVLRLRTAKDAHPAIRELMIPVLRELQEVYPEIFNDIEVTA
nr:MAG TPA: Thymidylate synthase complementing protein [Caudoviricetes sp.]